MLKNLAALALLLAVGMGGVTGCFYKEKERVATPAPSTVVVTQPANRVVTYAQGRYELHGRGTAVDPYFWVWVPAGTDAAMLPAPPPLPHS